MSPLPDSIPAPGAIFGSILRFCAMKKESR